MEVINFETCKQVVNAMVPRDVVFIQTLQLEQMQKDPLRAFNSGLGAAQAARLDKAELQIGILLGLNLALASANPGFQATIAINFGKGGTYGKENEKESSQTSEKSQ